MTYPCPKCGAYLQSGATYCDQCGEELRLVSSSAATDTTAIPRISVAPVVESVFLQEPIGSLADCAKIVVEVEVNRRHFLNHLSLLRFRITNNMPQAYEACIRMRLYGQGRFVEQQERDVEQYCRLERRGDQFEFSFPFQPLTAGQIRIDQLRILIVRGDRSEKALVYELPDQSLFVDVSDPSVDRVKAGVAISGGIHIDLSQLQEMYGSDIKSLLNVQQPTTPDHAAVAWQPIRLRVADRCERALIEFEQRKSTPRAPRDTSSIRPMLSGMLVFEHTGARIILLPKQNVTVGRARENDIVVRFLPRSPAHDALSRNISRTHMALELTDAGLTVRDQGSKTGVEIDVRSVRDSMTVSADRAGRPIPLVLGGRDLAAEAFTLQLELFHACDQDFRHRGPWDRDQLICDLLGAHVSYMWQTARKSGISTAKLIRVTNVTEESYVLLFREALIGSAIDLCPIVVGDFNDLETPARIFHVKNCFWLETFVGQGFIRVNDRPIENPELVPLAPEDRLQFGETLVTFRDARQLHL